MSPENGIIEAFTELAPRYETVMDSELGRFWGWRYADFVDHLIGMTPLKPGDVILDVATGTGLIPRKIQRSGNNPHQHTGWISPWQCSKEPGKMRTKYFWIPQPMLIRTSKNPPGE